jgi:hypothetical protein
MQFPSVLDPLAYDTRHENCKNKARHFAVSMIRTASQAFVLRFNFFLTLQATYMTCVVDGLHTR